MLGCQIILDFNYLYIQLSYTYWNWKLEHL